MRKDFSNLCIYLLMLRMSTYCDNNKQNLVQNNNLVGSVSLKCKLITVKHKAAGILRKYFHFMMT